MAMALFRFLGAILKSMVIANTFGMSVLLIIFIFGGFIIPRGKHIFTEKSFIFHYIGMINQLSASHFYGPK